MPLSKHTSKLGLAALVSLVLTNLPATSLAQAKENPAPHTKPSQSPQNGPRSDDSNPAAGVVANMRPIDSEAILVVPRPSGDPQGAKKWCNTLSGQGIVSVTITNIVIYLIIDCTDEGKGVL